MKVYIVLWQIPAMNDNGFTIEVDSAWMTEDMANKEAARLNGWVVEREVIEKEEKG